MMLSRGEVEECRHAGCGPFLGELIRSLIGRAFRDCSYLNLPEERNVRRWAVYGSSS